MMLSSLCLLIGEKPRTQALPSGICWCKHGTDGFLWKEAAETARTVFNEQRKTFCCLAASNSESGFIRCECITACVASGPERPQLQLLRILAAARQPVEGKAGGDGDLCSLREWSVECNIDLGAWACES